MSEITLSKKGQKQQKELLELFKSKLFDIYNNTVVEFAEISSFDMMGEGYADFKGQIIDELKGDYSELRFFSKEDLDDVLLSIAKNNSNLLEKIIVNNYENQIEELKMQIEKLLGF